MRPSRVPNEPDALRHALACLLLLAACREDNSASNLAEYRQTVVFGTDDRIEVYAHPDPELGVLAREAVVALVPSDELDLTHPDAIRLRSPSLQEAYGLCDDQRFLDQPTAASCSGTLVDVDLVLTAGHCIPSLAACRTRRFVFDYHYEADAQLASISAADVYSCQDVVVRRFDATDDFAIVQLDRPVDAARVPAAVRRDPLPLAVGDPLTVIGFGSGIPAKIDGGGHVLDARAAQLDYFANSLDTFVGSSGSGVFDASRTLVGILVRGVEDYVSSGDCFVVNTLPDPPPDGVGEHAVYVHRAIQALCDSGFPSPRLCGGPAGDGWCDACASADDCPGGWTCAISGLAEDGCALPCDGDAGCRADHHCAASGLCQPNLQSICSAGDVWHFDSCGRPVQLADDCTPDERCEQGVCVLRPEGDICSNPREVAAVDQTLEGSLHGGFFGDEQGSCGGAGVEEIIAFDLPSPMLLDATASGFDTVLYLRRSCSVASTELACVDDSDPPGGGGSHLRLALPAGPAWLFVDTASTRAGSYQLMLDFGPRDAPPGDTCGNATEIEPIAQSLDGELAPAYLDDGQGSCGGAGPDRIYAFDLPEPTRLDAMAASPGTVLHLRSTCADASAELACDGMHSDGDLGASLSRALTPGRYFLWVDAAFTATGAFGVELDFTSLCSEPCVLGERRCGVDAPEMCLRGLQGCPEFSALEACGRAELCIAGRCERQCSDACSPGAVACSGDTHAISCGDVDGDGCVEWSAPTACPGALVCQRGHCGCPAPACRDGERRCVGDAYRQCTSDAWGCLEWTAAIACPTESCGDGGCNRCLDGACILCPDDELEPNDSPGSATAIPAGRLEGLFACALDVDWLAFQVQAQERVRIDVEHSIHDNALYVELLDADLRGLANATTEGGSARMEWLAVRAEELFMRVTARAPVATEYQLNLAIIADCSTREECGVSPPTWPDVGTTDLDPIAAANEDMPRDAEGCSCHAAGGARPALVMIVLVALVLRRIWRGRLRS